MVITDIKKSSDGINGWGQIYNEPAEPFSGIVEGSEYFKYIYDTKIQRVGSNGCDVTLTKRSNQ